MWRPDVSHEMVGFMMGAREEIYIFKCELTFLGVTEIEDRTGRLELYLCDVQIILAMDCMIYVQPWHQH